MLTFREHLNWWLNNGNDFRQGSIELMSHTDEKIQNDVRDDNVERTKENHGCSETSTISFPVISSRGTEWR